MSRAAVRITQSTADQVVSSGCTYLLVLLVARSVSPHDFGLFLIGFGVATVTTAVGRAAFGAVLGMDLPVLGAEDGRRQEARSVAAVLILGVAVGAALAVFAVLARGQGEPAVLVVSVALPIALLQDVTRFGLVARGRPAVALVADLLWFLPCLALIVVDLGRGDTAAPGIVAVVWLAGLLASLTWLCSRGVVQRPVFGGLGEWFVSDKRRSHLAADSGMASLAPFGNAVGAAAAAGADATAAVRGAAAVFAPLAMLSLAVSLGAVPEAKRRDPRGALRFLSGVTILLAIVSAAWALLLVKIPPDIGEELLGQTWRTAEPVVPFLGLEYVGIAVWTGATAMLRFTDSTSTALRIRLAYAPSTLVLPVIALVVTNDVRAFAATLAVLGVAVGVIGLTIGVGRMRRAS